MSSNIAGILVANPEAFDTVPDLRRELHSANERLKGYAQDLRHQSNVGTELAGIVNAALMQHLRGNHGAVAAMLDAQLEASPRLREKLEEANESNELHQVMQWVKTAEQESPQAYNCEGEDPWSMKTVEELRRALDIANHAGMRLASEHDSLKKLLESMSREVSVIVVAHMKGDRDALSRAVADFCERRVVVKNGDNRQVH